MTSRFPSDRFNLPSLFLLTFERSNRHHWRYHFIGKNRMPYAFLNRTADRLRIVSSPGFKSRSHVRANSQKHETQTREEFASGERLYRKYLDVMQVHINVENVAG